MQFLRSIFLPGVAVSVLMAGLSFVINEVILGAEHEKYTFFRPDSHPLVFPGLIVTSLFWGQALAIGYRVMGRRLPITRRHLRGMAFGALIFLFAALHELFYFQFIEFSPAIMLGSEAHYLLSYLLGGLLIGALDRDPPG